MEDPIDYENLAANVQNLLKQKAGRDFIWHLIDITGVYSNTFTGDRRGDFLEGRRAVGLEVIELMQEASPTAYARLLLSKQKEKDGKNDN